MKKTIKAFFAIAFAVLAFISCGKENSTPVNDGQLVEITLIAGNPDVQPANPATRTMMVGSTPKWCDGDRIGVSDGSSTNYVFTENSIADGETASTAAFQGTAVSGTLYAYSPYNNIKSEGVTAKGAKIDIPANQNPTVNSFDGAADIMVAQSFSVDPENTTVNGLKFARLGAIVKIVLTDTESTMIGDQHPTTVSLTASSNLVGRVYIDMKNQCLNDTEGIYSGASSTVTANYTAGTKYAINGSNATYLVVYPQTLAAGSILTITASTEDYAIEKAITVPAGGIELLPGKVNTLNISLLASHITEDTGAELPFNDNFSWQTLTGTSEMTFESSPAIPSAKYSAYNKVFQGGTSGVVKLSTNSATGYLTTIELDLSSAFYVHINSKYWSDSEKTKLYVSVDDGSPEEITMTSSYADYYINYAAATKKSKVKITTTENKRAYINTIDIISGSHPSINVTSSNPIAVPSTSGSESITYEIEYPTGASLTAALANPADTWISNIDYSVSGTVSFDIAAQAQDAEPRSAVIVLSYSGADNVEVTINQAGDITGASLPFIDDMTWASVATDSGTDIGDSISNDANSDGLYISGTKAYKGVGGVKLGTSSAAGSITTKGLDLTGAFNIAIKGAVYGSDTGNLVVTVDETEVINEAFASVNYVNIPAGTYTKNSKVTIATSEKRGRIYSVKIQSGTYVPDPVINITSANPMDVDNTNNLYAVEYTISNPTASSISASANVAWIHDFDYSVGGEVSFEVDAQETNASARSGIITLSYSGAENVTVTVNQAAGPSSGGTQDYTTTWTASSGALGSGIGSGTINTTTSGTGATQSWSYTRTLSSGSSYTGWSSNCIQLGKNGGVENLTLSTSSIPGTIKSVYVECASYQGNHNVSITVGSTEYLASTATPSWTTVNSMGGTGSSSGAITISFTGGTRALYIKSITVVYNN